MGSCFSSSNGFQSSFGNICHLYYINLGANLNIWFIEELLNLELYTLTSFLSLIAILSLNTFVTHGDLV